MTVSTNGSFTVQQILGNHSAKKKQKKNDVLPPPGSLAMTIPLPPLAVTRNPILATVNMASPWAFIIKPADNRE